MKIPLSSSVLAAVFCLGGIVACANAASEWRPLFNGKDLSGWSTWLGKPQPMWDVPGLKRDATGKYLESIGADRDPLGVFRVVEANGENVMRFSGQGFGVLLSKESYSNYHFRLQFRWGEKRWAPRENVVRDSGILYHVHAAPESAGNVWPPSIELQIQEHDCGDLWTVHARAWATARPKQGTQAAVYDPAQPVLEFAKSDSPNGSRCIKSADFEKPLGEWNTIEVICFGEEAVHVVNGHVVLRLRRMARSSDDTPLTAGRIALQSEGAEVFYRNVEIRPLAELPAEYR